MKTYIISGKFVAIRDFLEDYEEKYPNIDLSFMMDSNIPFEIFLMPQYDNGMYCLEGFTSLGGVCFYTKGVQIDEHSLQLFMVDNKENMFSFSYDLEELGDINFAAYMQLIEDQEYLFPACFGNANFSTNYDETSLDQSVRILKQKLSIDAKKKLNEATQDYETALSYFSQYQDDIEQDNFANIKASNMMAFYRVLNELDDMLDEYVTKRAKEAGEQIDITLEVLKKSLSVVLEKNHVSFDAKTFDDFANEVYQKFEEEGENSNLVPLAGAKMLMDNKILQELCYEDVTHMVAYALCANTDNENDVSDVINLFDTVWDDDNASEIINKTFRDVEDENTLYVYEESFNLLKKWYKEYHFQDKSEVLDLVKHHADEWIENYKAQELELDDGFVMC